MMSLLAIVAFALWIVGGRARAKTGRLHLSYRQLAERFKGTYVGGSWMKQSSVHFRYGTTHVLLDVCPSSNRRVKATRIQLDWEDRKLWCEILPTRMVDGNSEFWRVKDTNIASSNFNRDYAIRTNDADRLRTFLSEAVQFQIDRLRQVLNTDEVYVSIVRGVLTVKKLNTIVRYKQLEEFTYLALELYDLAKLTQSEGIKFIEDATARLVNEAICQVCGEDIVYEMVFCQRCKTPHHQECWQYYGGCTTYGCQETQFVVPRMTGPSNG